MDMNFSVFQEPRGVMRIFQLIFAIITFATTCNFTGFIDFHCKNLFHYTYDYPFNLALNKQILNVGPLDTNTTCHPIVSIFGDFSSDARFFVATGVLAMLYCIFIMIVYTKFDQLYKTNEHIPLFDFVLTVFIAVLWLSSSASWANALTGLKHVTDQNNMVWDKISETCNCPVAIGSFTTLNISVILGFLNFFLWATDLWFLYKETSWFQNARVASPSGI